MGRVRIEEGVPGHPPYVGEDELLVDRGTGKLHYRGSDAAVKEAAEGVMEAGDGVNAVEQKGVGANASGNKASAFGTGSVASGEDAHAEGQGSTASGVAAHAEGVSTASGLAAHAEGASTASGAYAHSEGLQTEAGGLGAHAEGGYTDAEGKYSRSLGYKSQARLYGQEAFAGGGWVGNMSERAKAQYSRFVVRYVTAGATPTNLVLDDLVLGGSATEHLVLQDDKTYLVRAFVVGRAESVDEHAAYELKGLFKRGTGATSVAVVGSVIKTIIHEDDVGWDATLVADTANGAVAVQVTGDSGENNVWVAFVEWVEVAH